MKGVPLNELVPNTYFDQPVFLDKGFILLTPDSPVATELVARLRKWKYTEVFTEGARKDVPSYLSGAESSSVAPQTIDEDIRAGRQAVAARAFYTELSGFAATLFAAYVSDGIVNLGQVTEQVKKTIQVVHENRDSLLRFVDMSADGDRYLISHAVNTTILSLAIGEFLKAPPHRLIELGNACLLHEIGMFKLPVELRRSSQPLNDEQRKVLTTHTLLGYRILKGISAPENVALAALEHHERVDGTGYPRGLSGDKITEYAKIIAVACSYDAMISARPFKSESLDGHSSIRDLLQNAPGTLRRPGAQGVRLHAVRVPRGDRGAPVQQQQGSRGEDGPRAAAVPDRQDPGGSGRKQNGGPAPRADHRGSRAGNSAGACR